jgi:hypothetical protein
VLLASLARICAELQKADWQPRRPLLVIVFGSATFIAALYVLWLLPLPTHVALTAHDWQSAAVALRPERLWRTSARFTQRLPAAYRKSVILQIGVKSLMMSDLLFSEATHTVRLRTSQPQPVVICWPDWLQMEQPTGKLSNENGRTCLGETMAANITITGDIVGMRSALREAQRGQTDSVFLPIEFRIKLRKQSQRGDLVMDSPGGVTLSTNADRLSALQVEVDRFRAQRFVVWDLMRGHDLDDITDYKAGVLIEIDGKRLRLDDTMDLSKLGKQHDQSITYVLRHEKPGR